MCMRTQDVDNLPVDRAEFSLKRPQRTDTSRLVG